MIIENVEAPQQNVAQNLSQKQTAIISHRNTLFLLLLLLIELFCWNLAYTAFMSLISFWYSDS